MKRLTKKYEQWAWFVALWCGGLASALLLGYLIRWMMEI
jgi:hypothetical protein